MSFNILSRVAERVYWLGRYLERADATARLITVHANLLMDLPIRLPLGWGRVVAITGSRALFETLYGPSAEANERNVCKFMTTDDRNPGSIVRSLAGARENARNVRETMPRVTSTIYASSGGRGWRRLGRPVGCTRRSTASAAASSSWRAFCRSTCCTTRLGNCCASATTSSAPT